MDFLHNIDWQNLLNTYGYWAILLGTFLEGETIVVLAGMLVANGNMSFSGVVGCALTGSLLSDQLMFCLGKYKGNAILSHFPKLNSKKDKALQLLLKYDTLLIIGFRFVYGMRNITPIILGTSGITFRRFLIFNLVGAICWSILFTAGGYYFGHAMLKAFELFGKSIFHIIIIPAALLLIGYVSFKVWKKRKIPNYSE